MIDEFVPDMNSEEKHKLFYDSLTEMDKDVLNRKCDWVIEPLIFETGRSTRTPILSSIGFEMMGDSITEALNKDIFSSHDFSNEDKLNLLRDIKFQQIDILCKNTINYIRQTSTMNFTNFCNSIFGDMFNKSIKALFNFPSFDSIFNKNDWWISNQIRLYIHNYIEFNEKYNIFLNNVNHIKSESYDGNDISKGTWRDYSAQVSVNISQYIGAMMVEALNSLIMYIVASRPDILEKLKTKSNILNNIENSPEIMDIGYLANVYLDNYIYPRLYSLIANEINNSVYSALCNIMATFPLTLDVIVNNERK